MSLTRMLAKVLCFVFAAIIVYRISWLVKIRMGLSERQKKTFTPAPVILEVAFYFFGLYAAFLYGFWYDE